MVKRRLVWPLLLALLPLIAGTCPGGDGSGSGAPEIQIRELDPRCMPLVGKFPPGVSMLPGNKGHAIAVQFDPAAAIFVDLNGVRPRLLAQKDIPSVPADSDGDGLFDDQRSLCSADPRYTTPVMGSPLGVNEDLAFVAASDYEEILFFAAPNGELKRLRVSNPLDAGSGSYFPEDYPMLPPPGQDEMLTALSTRTCVYIPASSPIPPVDSRGHPIGQDVCCDRVPGAASFITRYTAQMTIAAGHLFVATSNLYHPGTARFHPGTVLVYDLDDAQDPSAIQPNVETPVLFTTGFNPTGMASYRTRAGRELVLVSVSGARLLGVSSGSILSEAYVDVIDAQSRRLVATIPMGLAALSFDSAAVSHSLQIAIFGSTAMRGLFAVDLSPLEDPDLYIRPDVVWLDGSDSVFPDVRIFGASDPFLIPARADGPAASICPGWTHTAVNAAGDRSFATDYCDGTLAIVDLQTPAAACGPLGAAPQECCDEVPLPQGCFSLERVDNVVAPFTEFLKLHAPGQIAVRAGRPGVDYTTPDVFFIVGLPEAQLCGVRIDSFVSSP